MILKRTINRDDLFPCALCENAPCTKACGLMDCAALLRAAWFDNEQGAARALPRHFPCTKCSAKCENACVFTGHVRIKRTMQQLAAIREELEVKERPDPENLRVSLAGFSLKNPFILDAPDATDTPEKCINALRAGFGGLILSARAKGQDAGRISPRFGSLKEGGAVIGLIDIGGGSQAGPEAGGFPDLVRGVKKHFPDRMVIAAFAFGQGDDPAAFGASAEEAGADALLLDFSSGTHSDSPQSRQIRDCLEALRGKAKLPLIVRFRASDTDAAEILSIAGKYGVSVLSPQPDDGGIFSVNRHFYSPEPAVRGKSTIGQVSGMTAKSAALACQASLAKQNTSGTLQFLSGRGVENWSDGLEFLLLGASAVCVSDAVLCYGLRVIDDMTDGLSSYLAEKFFDHAGEVTGLSLRYLVGEEKLEQEAIRFPNISRSKCVRCGRCTMACRESASGAMTEGFDHAPMLIGNLCTGCHLCIQVCPTGAITSGKRT